MSLTETATYTPEQFVTGNFPIVTEPETIANGEGEVAKRTVMGRVTASGEWKVSLAAAGDGSEVPAGILAEGVDATAAAVPGSILKAGQFNPDLLVFGAGHDADSVKAAFEGTPLFLRAPA